MNEKRIEQIKDQGAQNALNIHINNALYDAKREIEKAMVNPIIENFPEHIPIAEKHIRDARKLLQHILVYDALQLDFPIDGDDENDNV
jgi:hypothetical protein